MSKDDLIIILDPKFEINNDILVNKSGVYFMCIFRCHLILKHKPELSAYYQNQASLHNKYR